MTANETKTAKASGWTEQQAKAIQTRDVSIALSAGAGCGKTFVLTERFLEYFDPRDPDALQPHELSHLIAITFTDRAAREMRDRIRRKCYDRLLTADEDDAEYWVSLVRSLDSARVSTIHSFCGSLLRANAVEACLDPRFGVLEQAQADTLLAETLDDVLRELLADRDETTLSLVVRFGLDRLREMISRLVKRREGANLQTWSERSPEEQVACWKEYHRQVAVPAILRRMVRGPAVDSLLQVLDDQQPTHAVMRERCNVVRQILANWRSGQVELNTVAGDLEVLKENAKVQGGGGKAVWDSEDAYSAVRDGFASLRDLLSKVGGQLVFSPEDALPAAVVGQQVLQVSLRVALRYEQQKTELSVLDFNDLLTRAHALLTAPESDKLRERLSSQLRLLLVDEFQDTDPTQVELVRALCGGALLSGKLFFVGDHKQSIYRFRGAAPQVFRDLREQIPSAGRLPLTLNFRSQPAILEFVNWLFCARMGQGYESLSAHRPQVSPRPAIEFLWAPAEQPKESKETLRRREADWIARRLRELIDSQELIIWDHAAGKSDKPAARPLRAGDIALLFRALSDVAYYEEALRKYGLDYYLVGGHAFYAQQEIFDLVSLLRTLASPSDLVSLVGVLRSPMFSLSDETLFWLAQDRGGLGAGLFGSKLPQQIPGEQRERVKFAARVIGELRMKKDRVPTAELIKQVIAQTGYYAALLAEFLGERKLANLRKLIDQARSFDRAGIFTLADFISQLSDFVAQQPDEPLAATHPEAADVVRLMSIHQSKGLEFPLVVVPDINRSSHGHPTPVEFTAELGPLVKLPATSEREDAVSGFELHQSVAREEEDQELDRLLYVATTRAADYLILSAGVQDITAAAGHWMELLAERFDLETGEPCARTKTDPVSPQVRVTRTCPAMARPVDDGKKHLRPGDAVERALQLSVLGDVQLPRFVERIEPDRTALRQYSFSRLAGTLHKPKALAPPLIDEEDTTQAAQKIDPLGLGTLVHDVMAVLDLTRPEQLPDVVRRYADRNHVTNPAEIVEAIALLSSFLSSRQARALSGAVESHAELEFVLAWPPDAPQTGGIYLGGFIDRLWQDADGRWHIVDFKTNYVTAANLAETASHYEMQLLVYALAAEQVLGSPPASLTLHFLRTGEDFTFAWNDAARRRVRELVDTALAAAANRIQGG